MGFVGRSARGFTLVEMLIAAAIGGVMIMTLTSVTSSMFRQMSLMESLSGLQGTVNSLTITMNNGTLCKEAVVASTPTVDLSKLADPGGVPIVIKQGDHFIGDNRPLPQDKLLIKSLRWMNPTLAGQDASGNSIYSGRLVLKAGKLGADEKTNPVMDYSPRDIGVVTFIIRPTGELLDCYDLNSTMALCDRLGGTYDASNTAQPCTLPGGDLQGTCQSMGGTFNAAASPPCTIAAGGSRPPPTCRVTHRRYTTFGTGVRTIGGSPGCGTGGTVISRTCQCTAYGRNDRCTSQSCDLTCYVCAIN